MMIDRVAEEDGMLIEFTILSDPDNAVIDRYGVFNPDDSRRRAIPHPHHARYRQAGRRALEVHRDRLPDPAHERRHPGGGSRAGLAPLRQVPGSMPVKAMAKGQMPTGMVTSTSYAPSCRLAVEGFWQSGVSV